jgi:hypothetical protein
MEDARREEFEEFKGSEEFERPGHSCEENSLPVALEMTDSRS